MYLVKENQIMESVYRVQSTESGHPQPTGRFFKTYQFKIKEKT